MNKYETVMIINPNITDAERRKVINKIANYIKDNGTIIFVDDMGIRRLAYQIKKQSEGYYYVIKFECNAKAITGLERTYRLTDEVLKFIVIREDI